MDKDNALSLLTEIHDEKIKELEEDIKRYREVIRIAIDEVYEDYDAHWIINKLEKSLAGDPNESS